MRTLVSDQRWHNYGLFTSPARQSPFDCKTQWAAMKRRSLETSAIDTAAADNVSYARLANARMLHAMPYGGHRPEHARKTPVWPVANKVLILTAKSVGVIH